MNTQSGFQYYDKGFYTVYSEISEWSKGCFHKAEGSGAVFHCQWTFSHLSLIAPLSPLPPKKIEIKKGNLILFTALGSTCFPFRDQNRKEGGCLVW